MSPGFLDHRVQCNGAMVQNGVNLSHVSHLWVSSPETGLRTFSKIYGPCQSHGRIDHVLHKPLLIK